MNSSSGEVLAPLLSIVGDKGQPVQVMDVLHVGERCDCPRTLAPTLTASGDPRS